VPPDGGTRRIFGDQGFDEPLSLYPGPGCNSSTHGSQIRGKRRAWLGSSRVVAVGPSEVNGPAPRDGAPHDHLGKLQRPNGVEQAGFLGWGQEVFAILEAVG